MNELNFNQSEVSMLTVLDYRLWKAILENCEEDMACCVKDLYDEGFDAETIEYIIEQIIAVNYEICEELESLECCDEISEYYTELQELFSPYIDSTWDGDARAFVENILK